MGKKYKRNPKTLKTSADPNILDSPNCNFAELSLEQFEKSLAAMLETLNNKRLEFLNATQLKTPEPYANQLQKTPTKAPERSEYINYPIDYIYSTQENQWNMPVKQIHYDQSTASSGSIDSSRAFVFPKSSQKDKEMVFRKQSNGSSATLTKTPLMQIRKTYTSDLKTSDTATLKDLNRLSTKDTLSNMKTPYAEEYDYYGTSDLLSHSTMQEYSSRNIYEQRYYYSDKVNNFFDLIAKKPDMHIRGNKYYILGELSLETLLHRIYFEKYSYQDLREYLPLTLKQVPDLEIFLDTLYSSIRDFSLMARDSILARLFNVVIKVKRVVQGRNGELQGVQEFGGYKQFGRHATTYTNIIKEILDACKSLETVAAEAERICRVYLRTFLKEKRKFCCKQFHMQIFSKYFYNEPLVKDFLLSITKYFEERRFYVSKYPTTIKHLKELNEFFSKAQPNRPKQAYNSVPIATLSEDYSTEVEEKHGKIQETKVRSGEEDHQYVVRDLHKVYQTMESPDCEEEGILMDENEDVLIEENVSAVKSKKNKKKKRNNKKNKKEEIQEKELEIEMEQALTTTKEPSENNDTQVKYREIDEKEWSKWPQYNDEVNEFAKRLEQDANSNEKIKPKLSQEWIESLKRQLKKKNVS